MAAEAREATRFTFMFKLCIVCLWPFDFYFEPQGTPCGDREMREIRDVFVAMITRLSFLCFYLRHRFQIRGRFDPSILSER